jgi:hypothetical protein
MLKLLAAYRADRSIKSARRVREYHLSHPMACCILCRDDSDLLAEAITRAMSGK